MSKPLRLPLLVGLLAAASYTSAAVAEEPSVAPPSSRADGSMASQGDGLSGREICQKFIANNFRQSFQRMRVISRDPGGSQQVTSFDVKLQDLRDARKRPVNGLKARMLIEVTAPSDMRHAAYLIIAKDPDSDDGFAYQPSMHWVRRMDLRNTSLFETDFTFYTFNEMANRDLSSCFDARGRLPTTHRRTDSRFSSPSSHDPAPHRPEFPTSDTGALCQFSS